jgi:hypothetical protein
MKKKPKGSGHRFEIPGRGNANKRANYESTIE